MKFAKHILNESYYMQDENMHLWYCSGYQKFVSYGRYSCIHKHRCMIPLTIDHIINAKIELSEEFLTAFFREVLKDEILY